MTIFLILIIQIEEMNRIATRTTTTAAAAVKTDSEKIRSELNKLKLPLALQMNKKVTAYRGMVIFQNCQSISFAIVIYPDSVKRREKEKSLKAYLLHRKQRRWLS